MVEITLQDMTASTHPPLHKGWFGVQYRSKIGLHRPGPTTLTGGSPFDPSWDVYIGPLPFLLANREEEPYIRESTPAKRDRFDSARDAGENSLDSRLWIRSWTSWHLGAGQAQAEPLEQSPEVARFRFSRSAGMDVWTAGHMSLLRQPVERVSTGVRGCIGADFLLSSTPAQSR